MDSFMSWIGGKKALRKKIVAILGNFTKAIQSLKWIGCTILCRKK